MPLRARSYVSAGPHALAECFTIYFLQLSRSPQGVHINQFFLQKKNLSDCQNQWQPAFQTIGNNQYNIILPSHLSERFVNWQMEEKQLVC